MRLMGRPACERRERRATASAITPASVGEPVLRPKPR